MKKLVCIVFLSLLSLVVVAQNPGALKFLGIPIDGTELQFASKLKAKGFTYNSISKSYKGQFNGEDVDIYLHTNHNLMDRVYVAFPKTDEDGIKAEFNRLLSQFNDNDKYLDLSFNEMIPDDEDISYEITIKKKRYQASFSYIDPNLDPLPVIDPFMDHFSDFFTQDELSQLKNKMRTLFSLPENQQKSFEELIRAEVESIYIKQVEANPNKAVDLLVSYLDAMESLANGSVWFMIHEHAGKYYIGLYYDNLQNRAHGEDL